MSKKKNDETVVYLYQEQTSAVQRKSVIEGNRGWVNPTMMIEQVKHTITQ